MIVPQFWAEARLQHREAGRQNTVRRFGWSDISQAEAQAHAEARATEALQRVLSGEKLPRKDPKIPYNGAQGVPIREEIVNRHGETIITRNSYGARCLNSPNVLFVDVDNASGPPAGFTIGVLILLLLLVGVVEWFVAPKLPGILLAVSTLFAAVPLSELLHLLLLIARGGVRRVTRARISRFLVKHPEWAFRIYQTPAGLRVLAMHQTFSPHNSAVADCFRALGADPLYVRMCLNQQCFRARVSPKPWRMGMKGHLKPRPGVWPIAPERLPVRNAWIAEYEAAAKAFSACSFVESIGSGVIDPDVKPVQELHDQLCGAREICLLHEKCPVLEI